MPKTSRLQFVIEQLSLFVFVETATALLYWNQINPDCSVIDPIFYTVLGLYMLFVILLEIWRKKGRWYTAKRNHIVSTFLLTFPLLLNLYDQYQNLDLFLRLSRGFAAWCVSILLVSLLEYRRNFGKKA